MLGVSDGTLVFPFGVFLIEVLAVAGLLLGAVSVLAGWRVRDLPAPRDGRECCPAGQDLLGLFPFERVVVVGVFAL